MFEDDEDLFTDFGLKANTKNDLDFLHGKRKYQSSKIDNSPKRPTNAAKSVNECLKLKIVETEDLLDFNLVSFIDF